VLKSKLADAANGSRVTRNINGRRSIFNGIL